MYKRQFPATRAFTSTAANAGNVPSKDQAWRVGAGYQLDSQFGATTASGMYEYLYFTSSTLTAGAIREYKRQAFSVALKHRWGDHELRGSYSWADNGTCTLEGPAACNTGGYGAQEWRAGYAYYLTKTLQTYVSWAYLQNKKNGQYTFTIGGAPAVAGATPKGADPMAVGLGLRLAF